jgi:dipeptidyl aminopeptidase/acylaminoacyl peptidase
LLPIPQFNPETITMKKPFFSILLFALLVSTLQAQDAKKVMSVIDFLNVPGISSPQLSPNGSELIYILAESDWEANKQIGHLWRINIDGTDDRQITFGAEGEGTAQWSPDGKWISFITKRDDNENNQIYIMRQDGGEGMALTAHKTGVSNPTWSADSKMIYFIANDTLTAAEETAKKLNDDVYMLDENYKQKHLWKVSIEDKTESRITAGDFSVMSYDVSQNGEKILIQKGVNPLYDFYKESEVWVLDSKGENGSQLTQNTIGESDAKLSPNGNQILFTASANEDFDSYYNGKLFIQSVEGNAKAVVPIDWKYDISDAEWSADGKYIFLRVNMGSEMQLWQYQLSNKKTTQITKGKHAVGSWDYEPKVGKHIFTKSTIENPGDIFKFENGEIQQITHHYDYLSEQYHLPKQEVISWKGEDGVKVEGLIYYPHNYVKGTKYPLVVQTHGGPASSDKYGFSRGFTRYNAVLTGKGYVVLQPNYRGSTGYGDDFLRDMVGGYFRQSHLDVMAGVDYLIDQGIADPDRLVKMGWSAGGHMTNKLITFTDRFKAASSGAGAVNWIGMYAQSDIRTYRTPWFGGSPWQKDAPIDVYWNNSPLKDISNVTTPTLVLVGESDPRVPLPQSVELFRALRSLGVPTHLYVAPREPHGWRELRHRLHKINVELDWFSKYALEKEYEWEKVMD